MPRQRILTPTEQKIFDTPPVLNALERKKYFFVSQSLGELLISLRTPTNRVCFLVQLGYFRASCRFFSNPYHPRDVTYAALKINIQPSIVDISRYDKNTSHRHRRLILEYLGHRPFDGHAKQRVRGHLYPLIRSQIRPKILFRETITFLQDHKIEIPGSGALTLLILDAVRQHKRELVVRVQMALPSESKRALDALFEKNPPVAENLQVQRRRLTLLKRFSHSTRPSKIKENLTDLLTIRELYQPLHALVHSLDLTPDGLRYYAHSVIKSEIFQLSRRADPDRHLHLLCFIAHQYFHLHDLLIDVLLKSVQSTLNACQRKHLNQYYDERVERQETFRSLVENVQQTMCNPLEHIEKIAFRKHLSDKEKIRCIQDILRQQEEERLSFQNQITQLEEDLRYDNEEQTYATVLESRSVKLQNKLAGIIHQVRFQCNNGALFSAVQHYQAKEGNITHTAPTAFLSEKERQVLTRKDGKFRVSLYKAMLFIKAADAIKSGTLHVEESYRYRSLDDYLIPRDDWERRREEYLEQADLTGVADCRALLQELATALDQQYATTNQHILEDKNEHITFNKDGSFHVRTPKKDETDVELLSFFLPEDRYISLLEVLSTVNRHSHFLDAFQHWRVKYTKQRPPERVFLAGIVGYGCDIGTGKVARISNWISVSELEQAINWYFSRENVAEANDMILVLMDKLRLTHLCRRREDQLHTSSDGQKVEVILDSLNANYSYKYFGQNKGASAYTFIDERNFLFHSKVIISPQKEAAYVIDGLMHNDVVKSDIHSTDTGGYNEILFGVMRLLGFSYAPRIKNFSKQRRYSFRRRKEYEKKGYRILPDGYINTQLIEEQWDEILRFVATIKLKVTSASQLFKRLNSYSRQHPLYSALKELGKIEKSLFLLKWIDLLELRQSVEKQLNKGENANRFADAISFSRNQELLYAEKSEQEIAIGCNRLIRNAIICWNYLYFSQLLAQETDKERRKAILSALKNGSIAHWRHLNLHGEYDFSDEKLQDSVGFDISRILSLDFDLP